LLMD